MVDFGDLGDKAKDAASDHSDQVDGGVDKAADAAGDKFGHGDQIDKGADKVEDMIPGGDNK
jgi:MT0933-like antitoxin protein